MVHYITSLPKVKFADALLTKEIYNPDQGHLYRTPTTPIALG